jgi:inositol phosphorylceramide synthase catalytic subunit
MKKTPYGPLLSFFQKAFPVTAVSIYWMALVGLGGFRNDHIGIGMALLVLSYGGKTGQSLLKFGLPFLLTAIIYDSQRFYADYLRGPIHVSEPYLFDKRFFGISTPNGLLTPNEWFQLHTHPVLDFITGLAYLIFFSGFILISAYFYFFLSKTGTARFSGPEVLERAKRKTWAFFWLNMLGYYTYYWYAAAPPWYVAMYGLGPARMDVGANSGGCVRFDQFLGTHFFSEMYGRAADVFGAIPSLHVAYPLLSVYFAFQIGAARGICVFFYLLMCFSAVYLNHHYILDIIWGSSYALLVGWGINWYYDRKKTPEKDEWSQILP